MTIASDHDGRDSASVGKIPSLNKLKLNSIYLNVVCANSFGCLRATQIEKPAQKGEIFVFVIRFSELNKLFVTMLVQHKCVSSLSCKRFWFTFTVLELATFLYKFTFFYNECCNFYIVKLVFGSYVLKFLTFARARAEHIHGLILFSVGKLGTEFIQLDDFRLEMCSYLGILIANTETTGKIASVPYNRIIQHSGTSVLCLSNS